MTTKTERRQDTDGALTQPRYFSTALANKAVNFIKKLKHTKGAWAGKFFQLQKWQEDEIIRPLFGTVWRDGTRCHRTAYISTGRKNGKTELGAAIALYLLFADHEPGAEIYSCAGDKEQASLVFNAAKAMVRSNRELKKRSRIIDSQKRIVVPRTNSFYRVISADAKLKHGFNAHAVLYDELHIARDRDLWDVLATSMGARRQPLMIALTTAGYDKKTICFEQYTYARAIASGDIIDPTYFSYIQETDEHDDWTSHKIWRKANPNYGVSIDPKFIEAEFLKARQNPAIENTFRRLILNQWTAALSRWIPLDIWNQTKDIIFDPAELAGQPCYGGLDLGSTSDLAAFVLLFPTWEQIADKETGTIIKQLKNIKLIPRFWIPRDNIHERTTQARVPYETWAQTKLIETTEGNVIDYDFIKRDILAAAEKYDLKDIAYDRWNAGKLVQELQGEGVAMVPIGMGFASMSAPTKEFEAAVRRGQILHNNNPVLTWNLNNVQIRQDAAGNMKPDKGKSTEKIDGIVAAIMALDRVIRNAGTGKSIYETDGIKTF